MSSGIYLFNPTAEMAVANGVFSYQPPELLRIFEKDMAAVMLYFAGKDDVVLVNKVPDTNFLKHVASIKSDLPSFMTMDELLHCDRTFERLVPWGWSPVIDKLVENLSPVLSDDFYKAPSNGWDDQYKTYYNRMTAGDVLSQLYSQKADILADYNRIRPEPCYNASQVQDLLSQNGSIVVKAPFSSSGRGLQMLRRKELNKSNTEWINSILNKQHFVMAEKLHHKIADFSLHFKLTPTEFPEYLGIVCFETNSNGQFKGCYLQKHPNPQIQHLIDTFLSGARISAYCGALKQWYPNYTGFLGIDAMVIKENEQLSVHPLVEINPRFTMGLLTIRLRNYVNYDGSWSMLFDKKANLQDKLHHDMIALTPLFADTKFAAILSPHDQNPD
ncbi:hypothetical protein [Saccharicrinis sp. FJH54]|uniref:hypothetical protein n=1 Tax=Saccharicrinis sp. FJH54 TaxID=3344665 RepID=UPI0035D46B2C